MAHARLGPSNHRWPHCPGSVREEANYVDVPGESAIDGTGSHLLLEMCLDNNVPAIQYDQQVIGANHPDKPCGWLVDMGRVERVQMCLDYITRRVGELQSEFPGSKVTVESETRANPGGFYLRDDWWGTVDITITCVDADGDVVFLEVVDYKDGRGWVDCKNNPQLIAYLAGKMRPYIGSGTELVRPFRTEKVANCRMTIVQPRTTPPVRYQCSTRYEDGTSPEKVMQQLDKLSDAARRTDDPNAPTISGKHCQWCKANPKRGGHCVTATEQSIQVVTTMNDTPVAVAPAFMQLTQVIADPRSLTNEQLSELLSAKEALMAGFDKCAAEIQLRIEQGQHVSGWAMQPGRKSRVWNDSEEEIVKKLKAKKLKLDDIYPKQLASPAAILKCASLSDAQKKNIEKELVSEVSGKLTLKKVAHSVAQSPTDVLQSAQMMFGDVAPSNEDPVSFM